jgi:ketosteroid isomerase-like protein
MSIERNKQVVVQFIEAMGNADAETMAVCLTHDAFATAKGFGKLSGNRDRDAMLGTTTAFKSVVPTGLRPSIKRIIADEEAVAVEWEGDAVLKSGKKYANQYCMVFTMRDGLISQLNEYYCTILADECMLPMLAEMRNEIPWD